MTRLRFTRFGLATLAAISLACGFGADLAREAIEEEIEEEIEEARANAPNVGPIGDPGGRITEASRTPACTQELTTAIETLRNQQGMGFTAGPPEVETLVTSGSVALPYARDGIHYTPSFGIDAANGACGVVLYELITERPGHREQTFLRYTAPLTTCQCQAG